MALLEVKNLKTHFILRRGIVKAVDDVSFAVDRGESLGIVGESGCGKTVTSLSILRLVPKPGINVGGQILFDGVDLLTLSEKEMRRYRGKHISEILQDPLTALNPVFTIGNQVSEGIILHEHTKGKALRERVLHLMRGLGVPAAETRVHQYPHQFSGGMRQRVVGAIAIACRPELIIADEPTTSLDVTIQMQYLNLLRDIQREENLALIFITHDLGIVAKMCHRVAIMYAGKIVERATVKEAWDNAMHPYTKALLGSLPKIEEKVDRLYSIEGQPPSLLNPPDGCLFQARCAAKFDKCTSPEFPPEIKVSDTHMVRCWRYV
ncbi:MAG: transporter ATP-binding protein [Dehalococcoidales bacterium]|nr:transporter ATP-binding protein [Dehalococcoidales bacterium]